MLGLETQTKRTLGEHSAESYIVSLTSLLSDRDSHVRQFFANWLPNFNPILQDWRKQVNGASTIQPSMKIPWKTMGTALDYRLCYYFAVTPNEQLGAWYGADYLCKLNDPDALWVDVRDVSEKLHPKENEVWSYTTSKGEHIDMRRLGNKVQERRYRPGAPYRSITDRDDDQTRLWLSGQLLRDFFDNFDTTLRKIKPVGKKLTDEREKMLARYCVVLALFEQELHSLGLGPSNSPLLYPVPKKTLDDLLSIAEPHCVDDLCKLSWMFYDCCADLLSLPAILKPNFDGSQDIGGANGDLIIDRCLIDIKSTVNPVLRSKWLYQLLGYVLLDYHNHYKLRSVGIYLARQGVLLRWPVDSLIQIMSNDNTLTLKKLRVAFRECCSQNNPFHIELKL